jgi:plasmid stabilization system protein ParE
MAYQLLFTQRANEDIATAILYYDTINPALAERFIGTLDHTFHKLAIHPQYYSLVSTEQPDNVRDVKLSIFPYVVVFEIRKDTVLVIKVRNTFLNE